MTKILQSDAQLMRGLYNEVLKEVNASLARNLSKIESKVKAVTKQQLIDSPEYHELAYPSETTALFGFPAGSEMGIANSVVDAVVNGTTVKLEAFRAVGMQIKGRLIIETKYSNIFKLPEAKIITENGDSLPWLRWLLTVGDRIFVDSHTFLYRPGRNDLGRSKHGIMILSDKARAARVNPQYSGVETSNWLHRSLDSKYLDNIAQYIHSLL